MEVAAGDNDNSEPDFKLPVDVFVWKLENDSSLARVE
jgi:hypothetical protein